MDNNKLKGILAWIIKIGGIVLGLLYFVPAFSYKKNSLSAMNLFVSGKVKILSYISKRYSMHPELVLLFLIPVAIAVLWFIFKVNKEKVYLLAGTIVGALTTLILWIVFGSIVNSISSKLSAGPGFILAIILSILYLIVTVLYLLIEFNVFDISKIMTPAQPSAPASPASPAAQPAAPVAQPAIPATPAAQPVVTAEPVTPAVPVATVAQPVVTATPVSQPVVEAKPVIEAQPAAPEANSAWTCPKCGRADNTGNFCKDCGTKRP